MMQRTANENAVRKRRICKESVKDLFLGPWVFSDPICCSFLTWFGHDFLAGQFVSVRSYLSLRNKRFRGAKSEEPGFQSFARAKNEVRAKIRRGCGRGRKESFIRSPPSPPLPIFALAPFFARAKL